MSAEFIFVTPPVVVCGIHAATDGRLAAQARTLGSAPLLVCGNSLKATGALDAVVASLESLGIRPKVQVGVPPEPTLADCRRAIDAAAGCDSVLGIGGGSALDVAKAAALAPLGKDVADWFHGRAAVSESGGLPLLAAPTTAGTGSEATWVGVFTDPDAQKKASFRGGAMMPRAVVLDAALSATCPPPVTAHSGLDALVQAVEAFTSVGANPLTDALSGDAARRIALHLRRAFHHGDDLEAREEMLLGSYMAGVALNTSRLGLVHGLAHPIGARTGAAHGLLCGLLFPAVMRHNLASCATKYQRISHDLVVDNHSDALIEFVEHLLKEMHVPTRLRDIGLAEDALEAVARESLESGSAKANPRPVTYESALKTLRAAY